MVSVLGVDDWTRVRRTTVPTVSTGTRALVLHPRPFPDPRCDTRKDIGQVAHGSVRNQRGFRSFGVPGRPLVSFTGPVGTPCVQNRVFMG